MGAKGERAYHPPPSVLFFFVCKSGTHTHKQIDRHRENRGWGLLGVGKYDCTLFIERHRKKRGEGGGSVGFSSTLCEGRAFFLSVSVSGTHTKTLGEGLPPSSLSFSLRLSLSMATQKTW